MTSIFGQRLILEDVGFSLIMITNFVEFEYCLATVCPSVASEPLTLHLNSVRLFSLEED